jgi:hypothetical protein
MPGLRSGDNLGTRTPTGVQRPPVVEYPVEHLVGEPGAKWFADWENNKHPSVVRWFPPEGNLSVGEPLSPTNWHQLAEGPTLLFIHGISSASTTRPGR